MRVPAFQRGIGAAAVVLLSMSPTVGMREYDVNRISSYSPRMVEAMQRVTITIDDDLVAEIDAFMAGRGYTNRSEAIRDLARTIAELTKSKSKLEIGALPERPNEIRRLVGDNSRAKKTFGWTPKVNLQEGLKRTVEWFRSYLQHTGDFPAW